MDPSELTKRQRRADRKILGAAEALGKKFNIAGASAVNAIQAGEPAVTQMKRLEAIADVLEAVALANGITLPSVSTDTAE